jgi:hypothetical protein
LNMRRGIKDFHARILFHFFIGVRPQLFVVFLLRLIGV